MTDADSSSEGLLAVTFHGPAPEIDVDAKIELFDLLGRAHVVPILHLFASDPGPHRFTDVRDRLGVPPTTLTDRLGELTAAGFLTRRSHDEIPPRVEYTATEQTTDLDPMFEYLCRWGARHW